MGQVAGLAAATSVTALDFKVPDTFNTGQSQVGNENNYVAQLRHGREPVPARHRESPAGRERLDRRQRGRASPDAIVRGLSQAEP